MSLKTNLHVSFDGRCEAVLKFYERHLGAHIDGMFMYEGSRMAAEAPPGWAPRSCMPRSASAG
jgi:PhnB protein